jgi:uncharacterized protein (DUF4415 family)
MKKPNPELTDRDNPEWTDDDFARARPAKEVHPALVAHFEKRKRGERGPQKKPIKELVSLRIDRDVIEKYKATGRGWQVRMTEALRKAAP